jgi:hypothetical protein
MSFDRIWMCPTLSGKDWVEVPLKSDGLILKDETSLDTEVDKEFQKYGQFSVSLTSGAYDEQYLFLQEEDARRFFAGGPLASGEFGYREQERMVEGDVPGIVDRGLGFDRVELYIRGELVESK